MFRTDHGGFSLVELLVSLTIASVIVAAFTTFYLSEQRAVQHGRMQVETSQGLRTALDQITRDLRVAGRNPLEGTGCGFLVADANEVDFTYDANDDGVCDPTSIDERKSFRRSGTTLEARGGVGTLADWETLAENVVSTGSIFTYFQDVGGTLQPITSPPASEAERAAIVRVDVTLQFTRTAPLGGVRRVETASVMLRNRVL